MERPRGMPLRATVSSSTSEGLESAPVGKYHPRARSFLGDPTTFVAPVNTYATRLLAQALNPQIAQVH